MEREAIGDQSAEVDATFERLMECGNVMRDGPICLNRYAKANVRVMWVLKQNIDNGYCDYSDQLKRERDRVSSSPTWRRLAHASYGLLNNTSDFNIAKPHERGECVESLLSTVIVNVNKEPGTSQSSDKSVLQGYEKFKELVSKQIHAYAPDLVIVCMAGTNECLKPVVESLYKTYTGECKYVISGHSEPVSASVAWSKSGNRSFLWAYHPSYTHVSDRDYFSGIMNAYSASLQH